MAATVFDDPEGFWHVRKAMNWPYGLCEGSFYQTDDGILHMLLRMSRPSPDILPRLWVTESADDGKTWSAPTQTDFTDNDTKFHLGRLPDGRFYHVGNPDPQPPYERKRLVLSLSEDGMKFDAHHLLADEQYTMKQAGRSKHGQYGYPHTLIHEEWLYVIVSRCKEAVEVIRTRIANI